MQPWMHPIEYGQLVAVLHTLGARTCLEWGSGGGTRAVLRDCPFIELYVSIEHDRAWHARVAAEVNDARLSLHCIAPDLPQDPGEVEVAYHARGEHDPAVLASYVALPEEHRGRAYDFVLVDGRARRFCVLRGYSLLRAGGVLVVHDAQREQYHDAIRGTGGDVRFLEPWEQGQVCLIRKP